MKFFFLMAALFMYVCMHACMHAVAHSMRDPSFPTRDRTRAPCSGSAES